MPEFTKAQHDAATYLGKDACIVAGPGSGKTTVLVERYKRLLTDHRFEPREILAITFTEKAAANMKAKLAAQFESGSARRRDLESAWVSTIHGFCARLLRENAIAAGLDPRFSVLSPRESENLQWECLNTALDELTSRRREDTLRLIEALHVPAVANDLMDAYDAMRSAGLTVDRIRHKPNPAPAAPDHTAMIAELRELVNAWPWNITPNQKTEKDRILEWCAMASDADTRDFMSFMRVYDALKLNLNKAPRAVSPMLKEFRERHELLVNARLDAHALPFRAMLFDVLARFDEEYRTRKTALGRVDFNDLERYAIALLKNNPDVRRRVHEQFRQIMLDEFQDINGQQAELIFLLRAPDVFFGVGDINQSIYGFRHARPKIFGDYEAEVTFRGGQSVAMLHNFRSRAVILSCVADVLTGEEGIQERELMPGSSFAGKDEPSIEVLKVFGEDSDAANAREAAWIAHRIAALRNTMQIGRPGETRSAEYRDFAVLCRNSDSMPPILEAFDRAGIPYASGRRQSFLLSREGLDITALLSVIANPRDSISLATVLRGPLVGVSDEALLRLRLLAHTLTGGLNKFAHDPSACEIFEPDASRLTEFCVNLDRWRQDQPIVPLDILLTRALTQCGMMWTPDSPVGSNVESFLQLARGAGESMDLPAFLLEIESLTKAAGPESELSDEDQGNCVQVMTAHAAKGLEFPVTIIAGMEKGSRRESRPITFTEEHGLGVKWRSPNPKDYNGLKDSWAEANKEALRAREKEEENRLLYVAMTRAEEHLILSYSCVKGKPQNWAGLIDARFNLNQAAPSAEPVIQQRDGFAVSVLVTDADPPPVIQTPWESRDSEIEFVTPPVIEDQHETTASVTSLAVFGACPRKYYIQRSLGWNTGRFRRFDPDDISADEAESGDAADLSASRIGSAVHNILAGIPPEDDVPEARRLAGVFLNSDLGSRAAASRRQAREWAFIASIDGTIVRGTVDLWFEDADGSVHVVDYKTDEVSEGAAPERAREYAPQLALYAMALERVLGFRPRVAWLHFLRPNVLVEVPLDDAAIARVRNLIGSLRKAQDELRFDLNEGDHCRACQFYRSLCPAGRAEWHTG